MIGRFLRDRRGNFALMTALMMVPFMGAVALAIDYTEVTRQKQATLNALDAAGIATARYMVSGAKDAEIIAYAQDFFEANLGAIDPADAVLDVTLPTSAVGGGTLKLSATLTYKPYFLPAFKNLMGDAGPTDMTVSARSEIRLKNSLEVALVLDNSGSMDEEGSGSGEKRIDLLKAAAKQLVDTLALQANLIKQVEKPVQFALVPFAASVNVGPEHAGASWMDVDGVSPVHHENFDWSTLDAPDRYAEQTGNSWYKGGTGWGEEEGQVLSRFSLYRDMKVVTSHERVDGSRHYVCTKHRDNGTCRDGYYAYDYVDTYGPFASWQGCVEVRPHPYNVNDATASATDDPATLFVPMFAPDEPGNHWKTTQNPDEPKPVGYDAANSWWNDDPSSTTGTTRQRNMAKYFMARAEDAPVLSKGRGPNYSCTTKAITPLTDVSTEEGLTAVKAAIDEMVANGNTNVPEGTAWGWRTISHAEPFSAGRPETEKGNDKVIIVLTDGENTYSVPNKDPGGNKSTYAAYGYTGQNYDTTAETRLFRGTSAAIGRANYTAGNYTSAMNEQMAMLCDNAKAAKVLVMTVSLDLSTDDYDENQAIEALKKCSSDSRFRKDQDDPSKPAKLFWNATGSNLAEKFKEIADELSNLRIVG